MPISTFKKRVQSLISKFRQEMNAYDMVDIIQPIIDQLVLDFGVSRTAAKIRLIDAGYEEALGAFIYLDGRYVEPHKAAKGFLKKNQTFSVGAVDAAILICLALHLPYKISMKIINDAGHHFVFANQSHLWYDFVLQHMYGQKVAEVKTFLAEQGADPL